MAVNANTLINFGTSSGGGLNIGDITYSAYPLSSPAYLPLNSDTASYLTSSYPTLGAIYAPTAVAYSGIAKTIPYSDSIYSFIFGNNVFLGWTPTGSIITSLDYGNTWLSSAINTDYMQSYSQSINGTTVAPGLISSSVSTYNWKQMAYGNGMFVAVRPGPTFQTGASASIGATAVSKDNGQTWIQGTISNSSYFTTSSFTMQYVWSTIGFDGNRFIVLGTMYNGTNYFYVYAFSSDGIEWGGPLTLGTTTTINPYSRFATGNNVMVAVELSVSSSSVIYGATTSTGNPSFTRTNAIPTAQFWKSITFGNGVFVLVGASSVNQNTNVAYTSTNGTTWTARTMPASLMWQSVTFSNGYFVAVGQDWDGAANTNNIATSTDGITWTIQVAPTIFFSRGVIGGGKGKFIYQDIGSKNIGVVSISASATTFNLPIVAPMKGMIPYMKAG